MCCASVLAASYTCNMSPCSAACTFPCKVQAKMCPCNAVLFVQYQCNVRSVPCSQWSIFRGPLGHGPLWQKIVFHCMKKLVNVVASRLFRHLWPAKIYPLFEIRNTPLYVPVRCSAHEWPCSARTVPLHACSARVVEGDIGNVVSIFSSQIRLYPVSYGGVSGCRGMAGNWIITQEWTCSKVEESVLKSAK